MKNDNIWHFLSKKVIKKMTPITNDNFKGATIGLIFFFLSKRKHVRPIVAPL